MFKMNLRCWYSAASADPYVILFSICEWKQIYFVKVQTLDHHNSCVIENKVLKIHNVYALKTRWESLLAPQWYTMNKYGTLIKKINKIKKKKKKKGLDTPDLSQP